MSSYRQFFRKKRDASDKYGNQSALCALNHSHRSKMESAVCGILQLRMRAGEVADLQVEDHVRLCGPPGHECSHKMKIEYVADFKFTFTPTGETRWAEAKGFPTPEWKLKLRLWRHYGPGVLEVFEGSHQRPRLTEEVRPERSAHNDSRASGEADRDSAEATQAYTDQDGEGLGRVAGGDQQD